jgi:hypothetical protein
MQILSNIFKKVKYILKKVICVFKKDKDNLNKFYSIINYDNWQDKVKN